MVLAQRPAQSLLPILSAKLIICFQFCKQIPKKLRLAESRLRELEGQPMFMKRETKKDAHPTRLQTSYDVQAVQRDAHLSGTKVEINSENREEINKNLSNEKTFYTIA